MRVSAALVAVLLLGLQRGEAKADHHLQLGVRVGGQWTGFGREYEVSHGSGVLVDASAGWRFKPWRFEPSISVALYGAYTQSDSEYRTYGGNLTPVFTTKEVGPRISVHLYGLFAGISLSRMYVREEDSGPKAATFYPFPYSYSVSSKGVIATVQAGYSSPRIAAFGGITFQAFVAVGRGWQDDTEYDDTIKSTRLALGIEY